MSVTLAIFLIFILYDCTVSLQCTEEQLQRLQDAIEINQRVYEERFRKQQLLIDSLQEAVFRLEHQKQMEGDSKASKQQAVEGQGVLVNEKNSNDPRNSYDDGNQSKTFPRQLVIQDHPKIAFTAFLDHSVSLGRLQTLVFNKLVTNEGGAYNVYTGIFTCPAAGMYLFSFSVSSRNPEQVWVHLVVNDQIKIDGTANSYHDYQDMQGGSTALLRLNAGDAVWMKTFDDNYHIEIPYDGRFNVFTGVLLYT